MKGNDKYPEKIDGKRISDNNNKLDGLLRAITLIQISWFTVNSSWSCRSTSHDHLLGADDGLVYRLQCSNVDLLAL
jgi:hypothetical protein